MHHVHADAITHSVEQSSTDVVIVIRIIHKDEGNSAIDVNNHHTKHRRHEQLVSIESYRLNNTLKLWESINDISQMERVENRRLDTSLDGESKVHHCE